MTNEQKIEWVAAKLMNAEFVLEPDHRTDHDREIWWKRDDGQILRGRAWKHSGIEGPFNYTHTWRTWNPVLGNAATLELLEAAGKRVYAYQLQIEISDDGHTKIGYGEKGGVFSFAPTLPQALLDFAVRLSGGEA